ncbi:hypothetical protein crov202 [Cafeteria roenbergensis virus]|uniref:Uncharacterized protein n=1 Tax=Cafeteria roenbergensis virus (strain BV-PW1) TaxID=693272 RepID=E3T4X2_CROVB|nr:hypothetical protein crov202 [Cafeteria roenbergensis virus BV-PW1]ADO67235.1 hypothetical protein crov202 [Cafeteria roenbergensis virus BV-PW1]
MKLSQKELDIIKFNKDFEENDKMLNKYQEKDYILNEKHAPQKFAIDKLILKMRLAFDFLLNKLENMESPINDLKNNEELLQGTIFLLFFIGGVTLLLSGLMKE